MKKESTPPSEGKVSTDTNSPANSGSENHPDKKKGKKKKLLIGGALFLLLLGVVVVAGYFLVKPYLQYTEPIEVQITNVMPTSASVIWVTDSEDKGVGLVSIESVDAFQIGGAKDGQMMGYDDRDYAAAEEELSIDITSSSEDSEVSKAEITKDVKVTEYGEYKVHHVTFRNLEPSTEYNFMVGNGDVFRTSENNSFTTKSLLEDFDVPAPAYGVVLLSDGQTPVKDAVMKMQMISNEGEIASTVISAPVGENGTWYLDISNLYSSDGARFLDRVTQVEYSLMVEEQKVLTSDGIYKREVSVLDDAPSPDFVLNAESKVTGLVNGVIAPFLGSINIDKALLAMDDPGDIGGYRVVDYSNTSEPEDTSEPFVCNEGDMDTSIENRQKCMNYCNNNKWEKECMPLPTIGSTSSSSGSSGSNQEPEPDVSERTDSSGTEDEGWQNFHENPVYIDQEEYEDHNYNQLARGNACSPAEEGLCGAAKWDYLFIDPSTQSNEVNDNNFRLCVNGYWAPAQQCWSGSLGGATGTSDPEADENGLTVPEGANLICCWDPEASNGEGEGNTIVVTVGGANSCLQGHPIAYKSSSSTDACNGEFANARRMQIKENQIEDAGNTAGTQQDAPVVDDTGRDNPRDESSPVGRECCYVPGSTQPTWINVDGVDSFCSNNPVFSPADPSLCDGTEVPEERFKVTVCCKDLQTNKLYTATNVCNVPTEITDIPVQSCVGTAPEDSEPEDSLPATCCFDGDRVDEFYWESNGSQCHIDNGKLRIPGKSPGECLALNGSVSATPAEPTTPEGEGDIKACEDYDLPDGFYCGWWECQSNCNVIGGCRTTSYQPVDEPAFEIQTCDEDAYYPWDPPACDVEKAAQSNAYCDRDCGGTCSPFERCEPIGYVPLIVPDSTQYRCVKVTDKVTYDNHSTCKDNCPSSMGSCSKDGRSLIGHVDSLLPSIVERAKNNQYKYECSSEFSHIFDCEEYTSTEFYGIGIGTVHNLDVYQWKYACTSNGSSGSLIEDPDKLGIFDRVNNFLHSLIPSVSAQEDVSDQSETEEPLYYYDPSDSTFVFYENGVYQFVTYNIVHEVVVSDESGKTLIYLDIDGDGLYNPEIDELITEDALEVTFQRVADGTRYPISKGYNLVAFDFIPKDSTTIASDFLKELNAQNRNAFYSISSFEDGQWKIKGVLNGVPYGVDEFQIVPGKGYLLRSKENRLMTISGYKVNEPIPIELTEGWNLVSVHGSDDAYTAETWLNSIDSNTNVNVDNVTRWDSAAGRYQGLQMSPDDSGQSQIYGFDFPIFSTNAYFVKVVSGEGVWTP